MALLTVAAWGFLCLAAIAQEEPVEQQPIPNTTESTKKPALPPTQSFIVIVTDQERYVTSYDGEEASAYRRNNFAGEKMLCEGRPCIRFTEHYTAATACTPARGSLYTGLHARTHQALQTIVRGLKGASDDTVQWLDPSIATMGDYFRAAGYDTAYFGEWDLSPEALQPLQSPRPASSAGDGSSRRSVGDLDKYGFNSWTEPDLRSPRRSDAGLSKDDLTLDQAARWLDERAKRGETSPFLLVVNFKSPGDIQHWPTMYKHFNQGRAGLEGGPAQQVPVPGLPPTLHEDLSNKSTTSRQAARFVNSAMEGLPSFMQRWQGYAQAYMLFQKDADDYVAQLMRVVETSFPASMVIRTSDHGEMAGAHGGLRDKWYNGYQESIHVPLIISGPLVAEHQGSIDDISSSLDLLPTMLAMANVDMEAVQKEVFNTHRHVVLPGRNLLVRIPEKIQVAFFETFDHVTRHDQPIAPFAQSIAGPWIDNAALLRNLLASEELDGVTNIEAVVAKPGGDSRAGYPGRGGKLWKLIRFWDDPEKWSQPGVAHQPRHGQQKKSFYKVSTRTQQQQDELEMYDLTNDPLEQINLAYNIEYHPVMVSMQSILNASRPQALPGLVDFKPQLEVESEEHVVSLTEAIVAVLYLIKRAEREFGYGWLKICVGAILGFRLMPYGPYRLTKRLLAQLAWPMNTVSGALNLMIGATLLYDHVYVFPPFLPLLPDALAHENQPFYMVLGVFLALCGNIQLAYVIMGTTRGANSLIVCKTWLAEIAVFALLLRITPTFDVLDFFLPFGFAVLALVSTWCHGNVLLLRSTYYRWLFLRALVAIAVLVALLHEGLTRTLLQQGLITDRAQMMDINWIMITIQSTELHGTAVEVAQIVQNSCKQLWNQIQAQINGS